MDWVLGILDSPQILLQIFLNATMFEPWFHYLFFLLPMGSVKITIIIIKGREAPRKKSTHKRNSLNVNQLCGCL